jgi:CDP-diacylglycerol--serine O-phosphatidyltransferase
MKQIPNLFTLLNLVFGCIAIVFILQTGEKIVVMQPGGLSAIDLPEKIAWGSFFIFGAAIIDFLDGFVARLFKSASSMGKQLDSLADVVSFGVAPGLILFQLLRLSYAHQENGLDVSFGWLLPAFLIPCAAAWRLARFNLDEGQQYSFKGLPAPAAGLLVASFPLIIWFDSFGVYQYLQNKWVLYITILLISYLMVSKLSLMSLKFKSFDLKDNFPKYLLAAIAIVSIIILKWLAMPVILLAYVLLSLFFKSKSA